jgi:hypothetical protein
MHAAIYDAMVAAWDTKYAYQRKRPTEVDVSLVTALPNPPSPAYPAEHAVAAGAAAAVLSYLFPDRAPYFVEKAEEAGRSRLLAGVQYPSDVSAGLELGRKVAALVIERGKADGTDAKWTGSVPTGPGKWSGTKPILPQMAMWKTWVLDSPPSPKKQGSRASGPASTTAATSLPAWRSVVPSPTRLSTARGRTVRNSDRQIPRALARNGSRSSNGSTVRRRHEPEEGDSVAKDGDIECRENPDRQRPIDQPVNPAHDQRSRARRSFGGGGLPEGQDAGAADHRLQRDCPQQRDMQHAPPADAHEPPAADCAERHCDQAEYVEQDDRNVHR